MANYQIDLSEASNCFIVMPDPRDACVQGQKRRMVARPGIEISLHNPWFIADEPCYPYTPGDQNCTKTYAQKLAG